jgi:hypothetical protein
MRPEECKPYQRRWRDWAVDRNLEDIWLTRLNDLETLDLVSICEGHTDAKPTSVKRRPSVILIVKASYLKPLTGHWYEIKAALADEIERIWSESDADIELGIQHMLARKDGQREDAQEIILRCFSRRKRDSAPFSEWVGPWFQNAVCAIEEHDRSFKKLMEQMLMKQQAQEQCQQ